MDLIKECQINNKLLIIICAEASNRKIIHQYLENNYPEINKASLYNSNYNSERTLYAKCYECSGKAKLEYHYGYMPNNEDEWYSGDCLKCGETYSIDCCDIYYKDDIVYVHHHNMIVVNIPNRWYPSYATHKDISEEEFLKAMKTTETYFIDKPENLSNMSKKNLGIYISLKTQKQ